MSLQLFGAEANASQSCRGLTDDALVAPRQGLPARAAVGVEAGAAHVGPDGDETQQANVQSPDLPNPNSGSHKPGRKQLL